MELKQVFIHNLKKYRNARKVSQMRLAELCDSSTNYIGQIEIGNRFPSMDLIEKMAQALNIQPYMLFFDGNAPCDDDKLLMRPEAVPEAVKLELLRLTTAIQCIIKNI